MKYKQEFLNCYERKEIVEKVKAIIGFIEDKEKKFNKEIVDFRTKELGEVFDDIKGHKIIINDILVSKEDILYYIFYYVDLVKELEK